MRFVNQPRRCRTSGEMSGASMFLTCTKLRLLFPSNLPQVTRVYTSKSKNASRISFFKAFSLALGTLGAAAGCICLFAKPVKALINELHPPSYPWDFNRLLKSLDHASVRRGWEVYKAVCSQCHSIRYVAFRELVGVTHTEQEAKALAEAIEVKDGPDGNGEMFTRPGKLSDKIPPPFANEEAARAANNGAFPVDLTYIANARHNGQNYLFSLLTSWMDPPAGITLGDGQSFNAYFPGGAIGMGQIIDDGAVDFEDGTYASQSQIAKDVVSFLTWTANPEFDTRKVWLIKSIGIFTVLCGSVYLLKRYKFSSIKSRNVFYVPKKKKKNYSCKM